MSALASAFFRRPSRISADLTGQRALETPRALPAGVSLCIYTCGHRLQSNCALVRFCSLTLCGAASASGIPPHGNGLLVLEDISEVGEGALELPAVDGLGSLAGVLEGDAEVAAARAGRLCAVDAGCSVANLHCISASFSIERLHHGTGDVPFCRVGWRGPGVVSRGGVLAQRSKSCGRSGKRSGRAGVPQPTLVRWASLASVIFLSSNFNSRCSTPSHADDNQYIPVPHQTKRTRLALRKTTRQVHPPHHIRRDICSRLLTVPIASLPFLPFTQTPTSNGLYT